MQEEQTLTQEQRWQQMAIAALTAASD